MRRDIPDGAVRSVRELGQPACTHRKDQQLTPQELSDLRNFSLRILSEFKHSKETAEIGRVLKALATLGLQVTVQSRREGPTVSLGSLGTDQALQRP